MLTDAIILMINKSAEIMVEINLTNSVFKTGVYFWEHGIDSTVARIWCEVSTHKISLMCIILISVINQCFNIKSNTQQWQLFSNI